MTVHATMEYIILSLSNNFPGTGNGVFYAFRAEMLLEGQAVKLTAVQVINLPLWHKINKIDRDCFIKAERTERLYKYIVHKAEFSITCRMCDTYT
jgi:hypothetical protein